MKSFFTGDPTQDMETAKDIIGGRLKTPTRTLVRLANDQDQPKWSRIASIYALGFAKDATDTPNAALRSILANEKTDAEVRAYAAEALGNRLDRNAIGLLRDILGYEPPEALRESCEYALNELGAFSV